MEDILALATAIRRRSRDPEVIELCDLATAAAIALNKSNKSNGERKTNVIERETNGFDRVAYQRDYMRKRRAAAKSNGTRTTA